MNGLKIDNITKSFNSMQVLRGISFEAALGEVTAVLGPSGCGKSTLLSIIAGLEEPNQGSVFWNGIPQNTIPTHKRGFGLMFQDYMLFPHKNVNANVAFGLEMLRWSKIKIDKRVKEILEFVGLPDYGMREITTLSGGELQRIALARSLAPNPLLLMLDEPLGSLDRSLRERLLYELGEILRGINQTAIYVTHDQEEAFAIADHVVVMNKGQISQMGTPEDIYKKPQSEFVARFLGFKNIFKATIHDNLIRIPIGDFTMDEIFPFQKECLPDMENLRLLIRPDYMHFEEQSNHLKSIKVIIRERSFRGNICRVVAEVKGIPLTFEFQSVSAIPKPGESLRLFFNPGEAIQVFS
jgi:ABC-type Fe3+/spermidine/putrescine transport system ATPase subunit